MKTNYFISLLIMFMQLTGTMCSLNAQCCILGIDINIDPIPQDGTVTIESNQAALGFVYHNGGTTPVPTNEESPILELGPGHHTICVQVLCNPIPCAQCTTFTIHPNITSDWYSVGNNLLEVDMPTDFNLDGIDEFSYSMSYGGASCSSGNCAFPISAGTISDLCVTSTSLQDGSTQTNCVLISVPGCASETVLPTGFNYEINDLTIQFTSFDMPVTNGNDIKGFTSFWSFGDGTTSTQMLPQHTYAQYGIYTVCWTGEVDGVQVQLYHPVSIHPALPMPTEILYDVNGLTLTITEIVIPGYTGMISDDYIFEYTWGDGSTTMGVFASHSYPAPGEYLCCIKGWHGETGEFVGFLYLSIPIPEPDCPMPFDFLALSSASDEDTSQTISFSADASWPTDNYPDGSTAQWSFGDGSTSSEFSPVHTYSSPGNYPVCMTSTCTYTGNQTTICKTVTAGDDTCPGDLDGNGTRNVSDLLLFMTYFGQNCSSSAEPSN